MNRHKQNETPNDEFFFLPLNLGSGLDKWFNSTFIHICCLKRFAIIATNFEKFEKNVNLFSMSLFVSLNCRRLKLKLPSWFSVERTSRWLCMLFDKHKIVSFCLELTSYLCIIQKNIVFSSNMAACFMSRDRKNQQYASLSNFFGY